MDGSSNMEGRVEIFHINQWGTVCDDDWDLRDGNVVCRQLGYLRAVDAPRYGRFGAGSVDQPIFLDEVSCTGTEKRLAYCPDPDWTYHDCNHNEDAAVICTNYSKNCYVDISNHCFRIS